MTDQPDDLLDDEIDQDGPDYGDRLEAGFAIMDGRVSQFNLPEDSNGSDYELDEEHDFED